MLNKRLEREVKSSVSSNETASSVVRWKGRKGVVPSTAPRGLYRYTKIAPRRPDHSTIPEISLRKTCSVNVMCFHYMTLYYIKGRTP